MKFETEIKFDDCGEPLYDKVHYTMELMKNMKINDIIEINGEICKITNVAIKSRGGKSGSPKIYYEYINIFTDAKGWNISRFDENCFILYPIIENMTCDLICLTDTYFEVFNEDYNEVIEIKINKTIDENIINKISSKINNSELKLSVVKFKNLSRVVDII